jgi:hypothetical protein
VALVLLVVKSSTSVNTREEITAAARAPYIALAHRDARALCSDFTLAGSRQLARKVSHRASCQARVAEAFAVSAPFEPSPPAGTLGNLKVAGISRHGNHAGASLFYGKTEQSSQGIRLALEKINGRWRVSTQLRLVLFQACIVSRRLGRVSRRLRQLCPKGDRVLRLVIGAPVNGEIEESSVPGPAVVRRAGGQELQEFEAGRKVVAQTGCLACHRIGDNGNTGPGPDLTHIGSTLSPEQIEPALVGPTAPMPSFKNLPAIKLKDLVEFLAHLH